MGRKKLDNPKRHLGFRTHFSNEEIEKAIEKNDCRSFSELMNKALTLVINGQNLNGSNYSNDEIFYILKFFQRNKENLFLDSEDKEFFKNLTEKLKGAMNK